MTTTAEDAEQLILARRAGETLTPLAAERNWQLDDAYDVQRHFVTAQVPANPIAGYKSGATAEAAQKMFGLDAPFTAVLLKHGHRQSGEDVSLNDFGRLLIEAELGFTLTEIVDKPLSLPELQAVTRDCRPVIELADAGAYGKQRSTGLDLIAANGASAQFLEHPELIPLDQINDIDTVVTYGAERVIEGTSSIVLGDQWQALHWLVNAVVNRGWTIEPGQLLITGAIGQPAPGSVGAYEVRYGSSQFRFAVV